MRKGRDRSRIERTWRVVDDFPAVVPVTPEELNVVEAFLMAQVRAIMAGETTAKPDVSAAADSELPQSHGAVGQSARGRGNRQ